MVDYTNGIKTHEFELQSGDMVYTLTGGFLDHFGGPKEKSLSANN